MNNELIPGKDDEKFQKKMSNIDQWLDQISHVKGSPAQPKKTQPSKKTHPVQKTGQKNSRPAPSPQPMQKNSRPTPGPRPEQSSRPVQNPRPNKNSHQKKKFRPPRRMQPKKAQLNTVPQKNSKLRIIPLGGFEEIGKNMMIFEYGKDIMIVDAGFQFPTEDMLGVDYVIPDVSYLVERKNRIKAIFLTHGHLDHIGGLAYILPKLGFPPVYGTALTIGLVKRQLADFKLLDQVTLHTFKPRETFNAGVFKVSSFRVNHSIPDAVSYVINTPVGRVVHTGDFKFDKTPGAQPPTDFETIKKVGRQGVHTLISDSTNALRPGHTTSEKVIAETLDKLIRETPGRLIIASFSSLIGRLQQIMDSAQRYNRKIFISGRSMITNVKIAKELGHIKVPPGVIIDIKKMKKYKDNQIIALTTGSQGENFAALARIAVDNHAHVKIKKNDTVILSSSPIIGNETAIIKVINMLCRRGARVITNKDFDVHTSGHAMQEELKEMIRMTRPKYFIPEHGDYYMRSRHAQLAVGCGVAKKNIFLMDNGEVLEVDQKRQLSRAKERVPAGHVMVEGPERSEVAAEILMDRQLMAENGVVSVTFRVRRKGRVLSGKPYVMSRGFVFADSSNKVVQEIQKRAEKSYHEFLKAPKKRPSDEDLLVYIQQSVDRLLVNLLDKRPLVIPQIIYV